MTRTRTHPIRDGLVRALEDLAARLICRRLAPPGELADGTRGDPIPGHLAIDERRALAVERVVLGRFGAALGKRRALLLAGGRRPAATRGMVRLRVAQRAGLSPDGAPTMVALCAIVVNTRAQGELLVWRTSERRHARRGRARPLRFADHSSVEAALLAYAPALADGEADGEAYRGSPTADTPLDEGGHPSP